MTQIEALEERVAHLLKTVDELSDVVARQDREVALLRTQVARLSEREAERAAESSGGVILGDERPPHY